MRKLITAALAVWLAPVASYAQVPVASAVMYEVNEALRFMKQRDRLAERRRPDASEFARRVAHASLLGRDVKPVDVHDIFHDGSFIQVDAISNVDLAVGKGPINGRLKLLTDLDPTRHSLDTLLVATDARIRGELDLTTAAQGYAAMSGRWTVLRPFRVGTFQGLFLIPFRIPPQVADEERYGYLEFGLEAEPCAAPEVVDLAGQPVTVCPLESFEFVLGIPLTKAVVTFFE
jgi:hypothetical protein